jgi:hypothetical protein
VLAAGSSSPNLGNGDDGAASRWPGVKSGKSSAAGGVPNTL